MDLTGAISELSYAHRKLLTTHLGIFTCPLLPKYVHGMLSWPKVLSWRLSRRTTELIYIYMVVVVGRKNNVISTEKERERGYGVRTWLSVKKYEGGLEVTQSYSVSWEIKIAHINDIKHNRRKNIGTNEIHFYRLHSTCVFLNSSATHVYHLHTLYYLSMKLHTWTRRYPQRSSISIHL